MATSSCMSISYLYCYFGQQSSESFEKMPDTLYEYKWQDLPVKMQKHILIMISSMQKPQYYHGFGIVNLDLKTFIEVRLH